MSSIKNQIFKSAIERRKNMFLNFNYIFSRLLAIVLLVLSGNFAFAQTTEFTYQGKLTENANAPTANYDFEFDLYDAETGGTILGTQARSGVAVANGIFTVRLDFGAQFPGARRFLEIRVRPVGSGAFTTLNPRQSVTSAPYNIRSLSAADSEKLGGIASGGLVQNTTTPQIADFNISGNGAIGGNLSVGGAFNVNILNANTQFNLGGSRVLSNAGTNNIFAGVGAGNANTASNNSFFGVSAGTATTSGSDNTIVGAQAGLQNQAGAENTFIGSDAGFANVSGLRSVFVGFRAGSANTASDNSFVGVRSGNANTTGTQNSFFATFAGRSNTTGSLNSFFGYSAGFSNTTAGNNSFFGSSAGDSNTGGINNSFFGYITGHANTTGDKNTFFGSQAGNANTTGNNNTLLGAWANLGSNNLAYATAIGADSVVSNSNSIVLGRSGGQDTARIPGNIIVSGNSTVSGSLVVGDATTLDTLIVDTLGSAGSLDVCRNLARQISTCSSSLRYKINVRPFFKGLETVQRLRPITFDWKAGGIKDIGFAAEEVEKVEPLLTTRNDRGEIEGVKYAQITTVLVNAVKEQQQIIEQQQRQIEALKKLVCQTHAQAEICVEKKK